MAHNQYMSTHSPLSRRTPRQERGRRKVEALLDAAEAEFAELGYETATTNAVAARAGASIGSLYQYFPNKRALLDGLVERYVADLRQVPPAQFLEAALAYGERRPAFTRLVLQSAASDEVQDAVAPIHDVARALLARMVQDAAPHLSAERTALAAEAARAAVTAILSAGLARKLQGDEDGGRDLKEEAPRMLAAYLGAL